VPIIDLNCDLGEGFGDWKMGDDAAMLGIVSTVNVACGFHAGDPQIMADTFAMAKKAGVAIGAHPSYPDLQGFGRRPMPYTPREIERLVAYQLGAAMGVAALAGHRITHVKAHGSLGNRATEDAAAADAIAQGATLTSEQRGAIGRFEMAVDARIESALARAQDLYLGAVRCTSSVLAIAFAELVIATHAVDGASYLHGLLVGLAAVPLAPIANDVVGALQAATKALAAR